MRLLRFIAGIAAAAVVSTVGMTASAEGILTDSDISESLAPKIEKAFAAEFTDALPDAFDEIVWVCFDEKTKKAYDKAIEEG